MFRSGEEDAMKVRRRHRFQWNKDFDELARDASAVIKARCRDGKRLDWGALEQIFPAVPRDEMVLRCSCTSPMRAIRLVTLDLQ